MTFGKQTFEAGSLKDADLTNARLLIVDDQHSVLESLKSLLDLKGFTTDVAQGGKAAVQALESRCYDVMLLDLEMPDMTGHEVLDYLRKYQIATKVIVVSGKSSFENVRKALVKGAYDYIRKPYIPEALITTIRNALAAGRLERQHGRMQEALRVSDAFHRSIVNNSPDFVYILNQDGYFIFVNDAVEKLLHYKKTDLIDRHYSTVVYEEDLDQAHYVFTERSRADGRARNVELRFKCKKYSQGKKAFDVHLMPIELNAAGGYNDSDTAEVSGECVGLYGTARDITERKESEALINYQAYHDMLTGLPNRALFEDRLKQSIAHAIRYKQRLAVMFLDLDRFKLVNDSLGHVVGDRMLKLVADRIQRCLREEDTLSRFGGDEFTLLLPEINSQKDAAIVAEKILGQLERPFNVDGHELFISASIGISFYPETGTTTEALFQGADIAMYNVKARGKNNYQLYSSKMNAAMYKRMAIELDLRKAIVDDQLELYFQPKYEIKSERIVGMESLVRWCHPKDGIIYPNDFISIAEESKLIIPLGKKVLTLACDEICRWQQHGIPPTRVSINVSSIEIEEKDFVPNMLQTIQGYGLDGSCFEIELTENTIMKNHEEMVQKLQVLSQHGIAIAIDDFGTGYSSLSYLEKFPVNTLKIDRSFVQNINTNGSDACIVDAITSMARGLKLNLVAEGVETDYQLSYLRDRGCFEVQGYLFCHPQKADRTIEILKNSRRVIPSEVSGN
ncbi:MAG: EAL domain-containing protein [Thermodesulfobacteriota bacterium]|nr:EAL domain-containing protein [Thermodesulfobacteriota bacterium]